MALSSFPTAQRGAHNHVAAAPLPLTPQHTQAAGLWSGAPYLPFGTVVSCVVELAPGYGYPVSALGVDIGYNLLAHCLPGPLIAVDRARATLNLPPHIDAVAPAGECHCALRWHNGWRLCAHHPVICGHVIYENGALIDLPRSTALQLGVGGWPIFVRIDETHIPL